VLAPLFLQVLLSLSLFLSPHGCLIPEKAQHTLEDHIFGGKMGELDLIILEHQW
jgi:hypothetical protein